MKTVLIIKVPKISPLFYDLLEAHNSSEYCESDEDFGHYLYNLYFNMVDDKSKSGIFVTNHNLSLPEHIKCLRDFAKANKVKLIIVK